VYLLLEGAYKLLEGMYLILAIGYWLEGVYLKLVSRSGSGVDIDWKGCISYWSLEEVWLLAGRGVVIDWKGCGY